MLTVDSPEIQNLLIAWHENGRYLFKRSYPQSYALGVYDKPGSEGGQQKKAVERSKYICLDCGSSGVFMVEKETGDVYGIKGYGQINRKNFIGTVQQLTSKYLLYTETIRTIGGER